jgi:hypothetical protein
MNATFSFDRSFPDAVQRPVRPGIRLASGIRPDDPEEPRMSYSKGDEVTWNTSQGETHGSVREKRTSDFTFEGQQFRPTDDEPYYIVESAKTGARAAHKESALRRR